MSVSTQTHTKMIDIKTIVNLGLTNRLTNMQYTMTLNVSNRHTYPTMRNMYKTNTYFGTKFYVHVPNSNEKHDES